MMTETNIFNSPKAEAPDQLSQPEHDRRSKSELAAVIRAISAWPPPAIFGERCDGQVVLCASSQT
jgi:hypothetical protein